MKNYEMLKNELVNGNYVEVIFEDNDGCWMGIVDGYLYFYMEGNLLKCKNKDIDNFIEYVKNYKNNKIVELNILDDDMRIEFENWVNDDDVDYRDEFFEIVFENGNYEIKY